MKSGNGGTKMVDHEMTKYPTSMFTIFKSLVEFPYFDSIFGQFRFPVTAFH